LKNNQQITCLSRWVIEHDPYDFFACSDIDKVEDILQLSHVDGRLTIDVGYYGDYKVMVIADGDWDYPIESFESDTIKELYAVVCNWNNSYAN